MTDPRQIDNHVIQTAAAQHKDTCSGPVVDVLGQRRLRTDKHGAFDAGLFPALGGAVEGVDDGVGGDAEDPADGRQVALQHGEVELGVCSWRGRLVGGGHDCGVGFVVGDGGDAI